MKNWVKVTMFIILDSIWVALAWLVAMRLLRYDEMQYFVNHAWFLLGSIGLTITLNFLLKLYAGLWKFAGFSEAIRLLVAMIIEIVYNFIVAWVSQELTVEWAILAVFFSTLLVGASRF